MAGARELPLIRRAEGKKVEGLSLEEKAKLRRAEAFEKYSGRTKGLMDVLRAAKQRKKAGRKVASLRANPRIGTIGTLARHAKGEF